VLEQAAVLAGSRAYSHRGLAGGARSCLLAGDDPSQVLGGRALDDILCTQILLRLWMDGLGQVLVVSAYTTQWAMASWTPDS